MMKKMKKMRNIIVFVVLNLILIAKPKKNGSNVWNARLGLIKLAVVANFHMFVTIAYQNNNFNFIFFTYFFL